MDYNFQFVGLEVDEKLRDLTISKLDRLKQKFDWLISADVYFKEEPSSEGKGKVSEVRLSMPGPEIFASSDEVSFPSSIAETVRDLDRQLVKRKETMRTY